MELAFTKMEKTEGGAGIVFGRGGIRNSTLEVLNLRCLLGHLAGDVK